jgi:hypothetical protein
MIKNPKQMPNKNEEPKANAYNNNEESKVNA